MTNLNFDFVSNIFDATTVYSTCENLIRKVEDIGSFCEKHEYGKMDWLKAAQVFAMFSPVRLAHLQQRVLVSDGSAAELQQVGYDFIMFNCLYDNMSVYFLEAFRQRYVQRNNTWETGFKDWADSIRVELNGLRHFKYFGHTKNPLYVK